MEGPHGSGEATPEKTIGWLWGFLYGSIFAISALCVGYAVVKLT